jgi:hypothetical protein
MPREARVAARNRSYRRQRPKAESFRLAQLALSDDQVAVFRALGWGWER